MTKYIWITISIIALILVFAYKHAPNEPDLEKPAEDIISDQMPTPEEGEPIVSESGNIKVTRPQKDTVATSPILVKGEARVFEGTFQIHLKDANGAILSEKTAMANAPDMGEFGSFGELILFDAPTTETGFLEVFSYSAKDGSLQDLVSIPVIF